MRRLATFFLAIPLLGAVTAPVAGQSSTASEASEVSVRTDLLPGVALTVEAVEPGVYRVDNDGRWDLAKANDTDIVAGQDGGVWLLRPQRFLRLGSDAWRRWATRTPGRIDDFEVAPDGTVWANVWLDTSGAIQSFDGAGWTTYDTMGAFEVTPEGTVWAQWQDPAQADSPVFGYLDEDGWRATGHLDDALSLHVASADDIWASSSGDFVPYDTYRFIDEAWMRLIGVEGTAAMWQPAEDAVPDDAESFGFLGLGPDGTAWLGHYDSNVNGSVLVRFDGHEWSRWSRDTGMYAFLDFAVAPDGDAWFAAPPTDCDGVGHFDGVTWGRYLAGLCVKAIDITADGVVWVLAAEPDEDLRHIYVITYDAVAAAE